MSFDVDEEILQDFLIEAGEILEQLSSQLVELETAPEDSNLLNSIFRGFHTIKGGAGFLSFTDMVAVCHSAENVFDLLRTGERKLTAEAMDIILQVVDVVVRMFEQVKNGQEITASDPLLLQELQKLNSAQTAQEKEEAIAGNTPSVASSKVAIPAVADPKLSEDDIEQQMLAEFDLYVEQQANEQSIAAKETATPVTTGPITDAEMGVQLNRLLNELAQSGSAHNDEKTDVVQALNDRSDLIDIANADALIDAHNSAMKVNKPVAPISSTSGDNSGENNKDITDEEFEKLLDELYGVGAPPTVKIEQNDVSGNKTSEIVETSNAELSPAQAEQTAKKPEVINKAPVGAVGDAISEDEFENLLDQLHGKGQGPTSPKSSEQSISIVKKKTDPIVSKDKPKVDETVDETEEVPLNEVLDLLSGTTTTPASVSTPVSIAPISINQSTDKTVVLTQLQKEIESSDLETNETDPQNINARKVTLQNVSQNVPHKMKIQGDTSLRVDTVILDNIMNMVGELVLVRNRLVSLGVDSHDEALTKTISTLDVVTSDLQGAVMKTRMQPIKKVFGRFPRVVRDISRSLGKDIRLEMIGEETDLDKNLVDALADPLIHLIRNSVDHGIEMPNDREESGKPRQGVITLSASQEGDHILLTIADDGKGMDPNMLKRLAIERGLLDKDGAARLSDSEAFNLIFAPGFSTKKEISDISGRGVGMDVVKTAIAQLNGAINITSAPSKGTTIEIKVPLTLAILPTLMIAIDNQPFALPLASVNEIFHLDLSKTNNVDGQLTITVRDKALPLFYLQDWLSAPNRGSYSATLVKNNVVKVKNEPNLSHVVIVQVSHRRIGFVVDSLIGQEEVVIKALDPLLQGTPGMAGATITSDGQVALILDVPGLLHSYVKKAQ